MPRFFEGVLFTIIIFAVCVALATIIKIAFIKLEEKNHIDKPKSQEPKIYLIKQTKSNTTSQRKRQKRSPKIAFEGLVLKPEAVSLAQSEPSEEDNKNLKTVSF